ncbi:phage holin, LLH family [Lactobacillus kitasatonis]|uniref:phage holin, LLH family n=1 Tax=Lactobacillus kitasatonis TaxID=237446 RepID=UPI003F6726C1
MSSFDITAISNLAIVALVVLAVVYVFYYDMLTKKNPNQKVADKYTAIYNIAKLVIHDFDPNELPVSDNKAKAVEKVQEQAQADGIKVTDSVAKGAVNKAIKEDNQKAGN